MFWDSEIFLSSQRPQSLPIDQILLWGLRWNLVTSKHWTTSAGQNLWGSPTPILCSKHFQPGLVTTAVPHTFQQKQERRSSVVVVSQKCRNIHCESSPNFDSKALEEEWLCTHSREVLKTTTALRTWNNSCYFHATTFSFQLLYALWTHSTTKAVVIFCHLSLLV